MEALEGTEYYSKELILQWNKCLWKKFKWNFQRSKCPVDNFENLHPMVSSVGQTTVLVAHMDFWDNRRLVSGKNSGIFAIILAITFEKIKH